jgi:flagellar protein FliO/FliZ
LWKDVAMEFLTQNLQVIITAAIVLAVLFILLAVWRAFSPRVSGGRRGQRLGISEYYEVDKERRLVLVRRDNVEHLILIGGPQDVVIEGGIGATATAQAGSYTSPLGTEVVQPGTARPAPRAPVFKAPPPRAGDPVPPPIRSRDEPEL